MPNFIKSQVLENTQVNGKFHHLLFELQDQSFALQSGQFVVVKVGESMYRSYSVASHPGSLPHWEIIIDITPGGPGSQFFSKLQKGDVIETTTPRGIFTLQDDGAKNVILAATGCGIASIRPMAQELLEKQGVEKVKLFWGLRYEEEIFLEEVLKNWQQQYPHFSYEIILSKPNQSWEGRKGHVTEVIFEEVKNSSQDQTSVYLCGSGEMVTDVLASLTGCGFSKDKIYFEKYQG